MGQIAPSSVSQTLHVARTGDAQAMVGVTVTMGTLGLLVQLRAATQRAASTAAAARWAPASVMRGLTANTAISAERTSTDRSVTSSVSARPCAAATAAVTTTATVIVTMAITAQAVSGSALLWNIAAVMGAAIHVAFATVQRAFTALHAGCIVVQARVMGTASALKTVSVTVMMVTME